MRDTYKRDLLTLDLETNKRNQLDKRDELETCKRDILYITKETNTRDLQKRFTYTTCV